jgi:hypothetical protein
MYYLLLMHGPLMDMFKHIIMSHHLFIFFFFEGNDKHFIQKENWIGLSLTKIKPSALK